MFEGILRALQQPEYIHVLINPLPVYGLAIGLIALFVAICQQSRRAMIAALATVLVSAAAAWPVYEFGEQAYNGVLSMSDDIGRRWLSTHKARAEQLIWFFYALAILSVIALIVAGIIGVACLDGSGAGNNLPRNRWLHCLRRRQNTAQ